MCVDCYCLWFVVCCLVCDVCRYVFVVCVLLVVVGCLVV